MKTYQDILNDYKDNVYSRIESDYLWYRKADNLRTAIEKAFKSENARGKVDSHQCRVGRERLAKAVKIALKHYDNISEKNFSNFDKIHQFVKSVADELKGFGRLAAYDVAVRIAKYQGCSISEVHLHAGVTKGASAMGFNVKDGDTISIDQFPAPFNQLDGDHLENILCLYKDVLAGISNQPGKTCLGYKIKSCG